MLRDWDGKGSNIPDAKVSGIDVAYADKKSRTNKANKLAENPSHALRMSDKTEPAIQGRSIPGVYETY